jgi:hypothetical protein
MIQVLQNQTLARLIIMSTITAHYSYSGEHFLVIDDQYYAVRLFLSHADRDERIPGYAEKTLIPLIGTIRHHNYPEIQRFPSPEIVKVLQDLFGVALVPARLSTTLEVQHQGDRPLVIDNSVETIFVPSMITNFTRFQTARSGNLATLETSASQT